MSNPSLCSWIAGSVRGWRSPPSEKGTAMRFSKLMLAVFAVAVLAPRPANASFHLMQVEQVIGGVNGDANLQAIQLRMRSGFQNIIANGKLVVYDDTGSNPIILSAPTTNVTQNTAGTRVLFATAGFGANLTPNVTPNYVLTNTIPPSYLAAGSLTWESRADDTVLWRVTWGGAGYTGPTDGLITNDADGQFAPVFDGPLPSTDLESLRFKFAANALSTNNANDFALSGSAAVFTNSQGASGTVTAPLNVGPNAPGTLALIAPAPNPVTGAMSYSVVLPRDMEVEVRIHDVTGRKVRTLVSQSLTAGRHSFSWAPPTASAMPNGVYFLELNADGARQTRRFALLR